MGMMPVLDVIKINRFVYKYLETLCNSGD